MKAIVDWSLARGRLVIAVLLLLILAGAMAYQSIPKEADPDINIPTIYVSLALEGISPEDAERLLVKPMEQELTGIDGLKEMSSTSYQGGANVVLGVRGRVRRRRQALLDVREKVDLAKPELPQDAEEPIVQEINLSLFPVVVVSLSGPVSERSLVTIAELLKDRIESIPDGPGGRDRRRPRGDAVELIVDPLKLETYGLEILDLASAVSRAATSWSRPVRSTPVPAASR